MKGYIVNVTTGENTFQEDDLPLPESPPIEEPPTIDLLRLQALMTHFAPLIDQLLQEQPPSPS